jgi:hypothetical protein
MSWIVAGVRGVRLQEIMRDRRDVVAQRWLEEVLSSYPEDAAALFQREQDPFANPLGHSVREGTRGLLEAIFGDMDPEEIHKHLDSIIRIRAVQQLAPSQALAFLFSLKPILVRMLPEGAADPETVREMQTTEDRINQVALMAFDLYTECREEVSKLRINEVKRQVTWVIEKMNQRDAAFSRTPGSPGLKDPVDQNAQREDL